ncbi:MAG: hypothetical protein HC867_00255 [Bacteroidia bacterium]|nr:hypothetical protein [Bacteroidia bacterium]
METTTITKETAKKATPQFVSFGSFITKNKILTTILISLLAIAVIWFWKNYQVRKLKETAQKQYVENSTKH